ncbi:MAG: hypothetical protein ACKOX3_09545 [Bacteroidota bacterium]
MRNENCFIEKIKTAIAVATITIVLIGFVSCNVLKNYGKGNVNKNSDWYEMNLKGRVKSIREREIKIFNKEDKYSEREIRDVKRIIKFDKHGNIAGKESLIKDYFRKENKYIEFYTTKDSFIYIYNKDGNKATCNAYRWGEFSWRIMNNIIYQSDKVYKYDSSKYIIEVDEQWNFGENGTPNRKYTNGYVETFERANEGKVIRINEFLPSWRYRANNNDIGIDTLINTFELKGDAIFFFDKKGFLKTKVGIDAREKSSYAIDYVNDKRGNAILVKEEKFDGKKCSKNKYFYWRKGNWKLKISTENDGKVYVIRRIKYY